MNNFRYYKITLPSKVYVARAHGICMVIEEFYREFNIDDAEDTSKGCNEFLCFEPLDETCWKVNDVPAREALNTEFDKYKIEVDKDFEEKIREHGIEEAKDMMEEYYGYSDLDGTPIILEADYIPETEFDEYIVKIHDRCNVVEVIEL